MCMHIHKSRTYQSLLRSPLAWCCRPTKSWAHPYRHSPIPYRILEAWKPCERVCVRVQSPGSTADHRHDRVAIPKSSRWSVVELAGISRGSRFRTNTASSKLVCVQHNTPNYSALTRTYKISFLIEPIGPG